jgi:hypothetical protein
MNPGWTCPRRVGFLFPHPCDRMTPENCPDCHNGQIADPYRSRLDRGVYTGYDDYEPSYAGRVTGTAAGIAFTQADGEKLVKPRNRFEDDLTGS